MPWRKCVLTENRRAVGVRYRMNGGTTIKATANKEVILAAGAVQSPQLLELSGIGQAERLRGHGIEVVHDLPGVGENYRDHYASSIAWRVKGATTLNEATRGTRFLWETLKYALARRGALTYTAGIAHGFVRTRPELETPDVQFHFAHASYARGAKRGALEKAPGMTCSVCQLRPESTGSIHIQSADAARAAGHQAQLPSRSRGPRRAHRRHAHRPQSGRGAVAATLCRARALSWSWRANG